MGIEAMSSLLSEAHSSAAIKLCIGLIWSIAFGGCNCHDTSGDLKLSHVRGGHGSAIGQLSKPSGLVERYFLRDFTSAVFIADCGNNRVQIWGTVNGKDTMYAIGDSGSGPGQMRSPVSLAVTHTGDYAALRIGSTENLYVSDSKNNRIQEMTLSGQVIRIWGATGTDTGSLNTPTGIDVDYEGNVYVIDSGNARVQVFDSTGRFVRTWGGDGISPGQFRNPIDLAVHFKPQDTAIEYVAVSDYGNNRVQLFTPQGQFLRSEAVGLPLGVESFDTYVFVISSQSRSVHILGNAHEQLLPEAVDPYDVIFPTVSDRARDQILTYTSIRTY